MKMKILLLLFSLLVFVGVASASSSMQITVDNNSLPNNYQLQVIIPYTSGMSSDYANIRFYGGNTYENGGTALNHYLAQYDTSNALYYVKLPSSITTLYCEWGIPGQTSSASNGSQTFDWFTGFDDASGTAYNASEWNTLTTYYIGGGMITFNTSGRLCGKIQMNPLTQCVIWKQNSTAYNDINAGLTNVSSGSQGGADRLITTVTGSPLKLTSRNLGSNAPNPTTLNISKTVSNDEWLTFKLWKTTGRNTYIEARNSSEFVTKGNRINDQYTTDDTAGFAYITNAGDAGNHNMSVDFIAYAKEVYPEPVVTVNSTAQVATSSNFTSDIKMGKYPLTVQFTDTSSGIPNYWYWTFGDGGTSTSQNPSHTYTNYGNYTITLTTENIYGVNTTTKTNFTYAYYDSFTWSGIEWGVRSTSGDPGNNSWGATQQSMYVDQSNKLHMKITNITGTWYCSGLASVNKYRYGTYSWVADSPLINQDDNIVTGMFIYLNGTNEIDIEPSAWDDASIPAVSYNGGTRDRLWYTIQPGFDNERSYVNTGDTINRTATNVTYTFTWMPDYVTFNTLKSDGSSAGLWNNTNVTAIPHANSYIETNYWLCAKPPKDNSNHEIIFSNFNYTPVSSYVTIGSNISYGSLPLGVFYYDTSTSNTTSWNWDFGDGSTHSTARYGTHIYNTSGTFTLSLTATNETGSQSVSKTIRVLDAPQQKLVVSQMSESSIDNIKTMSINSTTVSYTVTDNSLAGRVQSSIASGYTFFSLLALVLGAVLVLRQLNWM